MSLNINSGLPPENRLSAPWMPLWQHSAKDETCVPGIPRLFLFNRSTGGRKNNGMILFYANSIYPWTMSALDKALVRDEVSRLKADFNQLNAEGEIPD